MKRSQLRRSTPEQLDAWRKRSKRIKPRSDKRIAAEPERRAVRAKVFERDERCVLLELVPGHRCFGPDTPHHLRKAGQGGAYSEENLVKVCAGGNSWLETVRPLARELGLEL